MKHITTKRADQTQTPFGTHGKLSVSGTHLVDENGAPCQLRGLSSHNLSNFPEYLSPATVRFLATEWKLDILRLAMYSADADNCHGYCTGDDAHKAMLEELIDNCIQEACELGIYILLDWHILFDCDPNMHREEAIAFFAKMSARYQDYPNVIYEICNEPNGDVAWPAIKSYALDVIPAIRANAPDAVIIVGTPTWSQDVDIAANDRITGYTNLMYALHFYADTHRQGLRDKLITASDAGLAIFVTEFGICNASGDGDINHEETNLWLQLMNERRISYVLWNLSNKAETSSILDSHCTKTSDFTDADLSPCGKWFVQMMHS